VLAHLQDDIYMEDMIFTEGSYCQTRATACPALPSELLYTLSRGWLGICCGNQKGTTKPGTATCQLNKILDCRQIQKQGTQSSFKYHTCKGHSDVPRTACVKEARPAQRPTQ
jgi:hypothetical protein